MLAFTVFTTIVAAGHIGRGGDSGVAVVGARRRVAYSGGGGENDGTVATDVVTVW